MVDGVSYRVKKGAVSGQPYFYSAPGEEQLFVDTKKSVITTPKGNIRFERFLDNGADRRVLASSYGDVEEQKKAMGP